MTESRLLNEAAGAAVTVVASFLPLSPVIGGGVAGYLEAGRVEADTKTGLRVGAVSGLIAFVPLFLVTFLVLGVVSLIAGHAFGWLPRGFVAVFLVSFAFLMLSYTVVLSAVGGAIGVYLASSDN